METVGVIGLGQMGRHVVTNLLSAGYRVVVHNRSRPSVERAVAQGAAAADDPADLAARCGLVLTLLPADAEVSDVFLGDHGVLSAAAPGTAVVDMSTVAPATARRIAEAAADRDVHAVDAPVSGGPQAAHDATMAIMAGGDAEAFAAVRPVLAVLGGPVHVGPAGSGQMTKAANQVIVAGILQSVSEAMVLLDAAGVDSAAAFEAIGGGLAANRVLSSKGADMLRRNFEPGGRVALHHKDLGIALAAAGEHGVFAPTTALIHQLFAALRHTGRGDLDHSALLALADELSGR